MKSKINLTRKRDGNPSDVWRNEEERPREQQESKLFSRNPSSKV